jgi:hypothetical protein
VNGSIDGAMAKSCPPEPSGNRVGGCRKKSRKRKEAKEREKRRESRKQKEKAMKRIVDERYVIYIYPPGSYRERVRVRVEILILNIEGIPNVKPSIGKKKKKRERSFSLPLALWHRVANAARNPCILHRGRGRIREASFEIRDGSTLPVRHNMKLNISVGSLFVGRRRAAPGPSVIPGSPGIK